MRLPGNESFRLCLREWDVAIPGLPAPLDGLRIVQLTDLHMARCFRPAFFERVVDACRGWEADLVVLTGDIIEDDAVIAWIEPSLAPLEARLGKLAILGNHDEDHQPAAIVAELARAGFETLEGRWTTLDADGATIAIGGTSAPWGPDVDPAAMPPADFRILLSHSPDRFYRAVEWGIDLMLSGHNHGGQIRLPLSRRRVHAEHLLAAVRPRLLPPRPDADVRQRRHRRQCTPCATAARRRSRGSCCGRHRPERIGCESEGTTVHPRKRPARQRVRGLSVAGDAAV